MRKKNLLLIIASLLLLAVIFHSPIGPQFNLQIVKPVGASSNTIIVPTNFSTIQEAINAANSGDTVLVLADTYYENVVVNKTVWLKGESKANTIIDGSLNRTVIKVSADNVNIAGFTIQNGGGYPYSGIFIGNSTGNTISNNIIRNNAYGIELIKSNGSSIIGNTIMNSSWAGIYISGSNENIFYDNIVANNSVGAWIASSTIPNTFYHNNFIDNPTQAFSVPFTNWNGTEGNYWSDYTGIDTDGDGIGETPHLGIDYHPLIIPTRPFPVVWDDIIYPVALLGNSTVSRFYFSQPSKEIGFYVNGLLNKTGFCNVTIPKQLLRAEPLSAWAVSVDDQPPLSLILTENATHSFLYFTYNHSASRIRIIGTAVIPEFPAAMFLPLFIIVMLLAAALRKRGRERYRHSSFKPKAIFHVSPSYSGGNKRKRRIPYALLPRVRR